MNLISEFCSKGNLQSVLKTDDAIDMKLALKFIVGAAKGLVTLHAWEPPIFHRDIKSLNILVTSENLAKISDFGTSVFSQNSAPGANQGVVGSLPWCAPEILSRGAFTEAADIFSFGVVIWEVINRVLTGKYQIPYAGIKFNSDAEFIVQLTSGLRPTLPVGITDDLKKLLEHTWSIEPTARPSAAELLSQVMKIQAAI